MLLKLKSCTILHPLTFARPLTPLACHGVRMFVRCWPTQIARSTYLLQWWTMLLHWRSQPVSCLLAVSVCLCVVLALSWVVWRRDVMTESVSCWLSPDSLHVGSLLSLSVCLSVCHTVTLSRMMPAQCVWPTCIMHGCYVCMFNTHVKVIGRFEWIFLGNYKSVLREFN